MTAIARHAGKRPWGLAVPLRGPTAAVGPIVQVGGVVFDYLATREVERAARAEIAATLAVDLAAIAADVHLDQLRNVAMVAEAAALRQAAADAGMHAARNGDIDTVAAALDVLCAAADTLRRGSGR